MPGRGEPAFQERRVVSTCVWPSGLAHFGHLKWPTVSEFNRTGQPEAMRGGGCVLGWREGRVKKT